MLFEASFAMFSKETGWKPSESVPVLLTNNVRLYHTFLDTDNKQDALEKIVNAYGFEHLIDVVSLDKVNEDGTVSK